MIPISAPTLAQPTTWFLWLTTLTILMSMILLLIRAFKGPRVFDRILAANSFGTKTALLIAVLNFLTGRPEFLDLALLYALMNFIGTIAVLRFTGDLSRMAEGDHAPPSADAR